MTLTDRHVERNGYRIAYGDYGNGSPVVLIHGFCGSAEYWRMVVPELSRRWRVIVPDLRGHGRSDAPDAEYTMESLADDVFALIRALGLERAVVLGHSLGGYVALALAENRPESLPGFGLVHSTALPDTEEGKANRDRGMARIRNEGIAPFVADLVPKLFAPSTVQSRPELVEEAKRIGLGTNAEAAIRTLDGMKRRPDRNRLLQGAACPVLLVAGERDQVVPPARTLTAEGPRITAVRLPDAGHMGMMETPDELARALDSFLTTVYGG